LGADVVKVPYTGEVETFREVVEGCEIPVVIAGGPKMNDLQDIVEMVHGSVQAGGSGLSVGRNIFQSENPTQLVRALHGVVHEAWDVKRAMEHLSG